MPSRKMKKYTLYLFLILLPSTQSFAQSFGLAFYSNEDVQDKRTSLDLTSDRAFCFGKNTDLSFDFSFIPGHNNYFGYVLRLVRNNRQNIDLLFDKVSLTLGTFRMVAGDKPPFAAFTLDSNRLFNHWTTLRLTIDFSHDRLLFYIDNKTPFIQNGLGLSPSDSFRISFGACPVERFKTTDVPPMKIRDVRLSDGQPLHHWPLDEEKGDRAVDVLGAWNGVVSNPQWVRSTHYEWRLLDSLAIDGAAASAFDSRAGVLYLVGADSLWEYRASGRPRSIPYASGKLDLLAGNQSVYDPFTRQLYNLYPDQQLAATFDFSTGRWDRKYQFSDINYWQFNKSCSAFDTSIYILNGYGHMNYKNSVFRYHIPTRTWERIVVGGDSLTPRYLAGVGATGDSIYILGGYGSSSGQQILNARNLYDMVLLDVKNRTCKKLFELEPSAQGFTFANSLVIEAKDKTYYGLAYNNEKYASALQLIKGSLDTPVYQAVGNQIPYPFHDIESFSDLYYSPSDKHFFAVVFFTDSTKTKPLRTLVHVYSLEAPPEPFVAETHPASSTPEGSAPTTWYILLPLAVIAGGAGVYLMRRRKTPSAKAGEYPERPAATGGAPGPVAPQTPAAIYLFGDMQVFDAEGGDLTKQFSPLLKELFLLILLNSLKNERGISSEKLGEILWFDKSEKSARNNRSVNIAKLKTILDKTGGCGLSKDTGYWKIGIQPELIRVDYLDYLGLIQDKNTLDKEGVKALARITKRGSLLNNVEYPWLDAFKSDVSNHVIDAFLNFAGDGSTDPEFMIVLADDIFFFDTVNEEAMILKCKALVQLGKHSLAKQAYLSFVKEYKQIYGEDFDRDFQAVIGG